SASSGGAHDAVEPEKVVLAHTLASHPAHVTLIWVSTREAISGLSGCRRINCNTQTSWTPLLRRGQGPLARTLLKISGRDGRNGPDQLYKPEVSRLAACLGA